MAMKNSFASYIEIAPFHQSFVTMREVPISTFRDNTGFAIKS
jgi:hypothetical protein